MNVIIANEQQGQLASIDVDIIKNVNGVHEASEIVEMFKSFFYSKMILDVTAIKDYNNVETYKTLIKDLPDEKIIFLLPEGSSLCTPKFLSQLILMGIYNFTTNLNGIKYLLKKTNTYQDVENIVKLAKNSAEPVNDSNVNNTNSNSDLTAPVAVAPKAGGSTTIIGIKNVTESAGATTLIYMLKKELVMTYGSDKVLAVELDKSDFQLFGDKNMVSSTETVIKNVLESNSDKDIILIDLNKAKDLSYCEEVIYLIEPSTIRLNKLVRNNKMIFSKLTDKKVILNQSLLLANDVSDFEREAGIKIFYNMPPLDERKRNSIINDFLVQLGLLNGGLNDDGNSNKIFGLFRR